MDFSVVSLNICSWSGLLQSFPKQPSPCYWTIFTNYSFF